MLVPGRDLLLIRHGASVKAVQARLGHKNASETLGTYSHLWPDEDDLARTAIDLVLSARPAPKQQAAEAASPASEKQAA